MDHLLPFDSARMLRPDPDAGRRDRTNAVHRRYRFLRDLRMLVILGEVVNLFEPRKFFGDQLLGLVGISHEVLVSDLKETLVTGHSFCTGMHLAPQANIRVVNALVFSMATDDHIARITNDIDNVYLRIVINNGWHVHRIFGPLGDEYLSVVGRYEIESNFVIVVFVDFEARHHDLGQQRRTTAWRAGNYVKVLKHALYPPVRTVSGKTLDEKRNGECAHRRETDPVPY